MCAGAIINARVSRVVFGAYDKRAGACGSAVDLFSLTKTHMPEIKGGVLEKECAVLLSDFLKKKGLKHRTSLSCGTFMIRTEIRFFSHTDEEFL